MEILKKLLKKYLTQAQFVFRSEYHAKNVKISDTNVTQYEFINQGTTVVEINGMELQPSISGLEPVRWQSFINDNENDVTIYAVKFRADLLPKLCGISFCIVGFQPCSGAGNGCNYSIEFFIDGVALNTKFKIDCTMNTATIQALWDANVLPAFNGALTITFALGTGLCFVFTNITIASGAPAVLTLFFTNQAPFPPMPCANFAPIIQNLICTVPVAKNKLLVISKVQASVRVHNP